MASASATLRLRDHLDELSAASVNEALGVLGKLTRENKYAKLPAVSQVSASPGERIHGCHEALNIKLSKALYMPPTRGRLGRFQTKVGLSICESEWDSSTSAHGRLSRLTISI